MKLCDFRPRHLLICVYLVLEAAKRRLGLQPTLCIQHHTLTHSLLGTKAGRSGAWKVIQQVTNSFSAWLLFALFHIGTWDD